MNYENYLVCLVRTRKPTTLKISSETEVEVTTDNISEVDLMTAPSDLFNWGKSFIGGKNIAIFETLYGIVPDILSVLEYPDISINKETLEDKSSHYVLWSDLLGVKVAEFVVKPKVQPPNCFTKCKVLYPKGKYKSVSKERFEYFHQDIISYGKLLELFKEFKIPEDNILIHASIDFEEEGIEPIKETPKVMQRSNLFG